MHVQTTTVVFSKQDNELHSFGCLPHNLIVSCGLCMEMKLPKLDALLPISLFQYSVIMYGFEATIKSSLE